MEQGFTMKVVQIVGRNVIQMGINESAEIVKNIFMKL